MSSTETQPGARSRRRSVAEATAWIDAHAATLPPEDVPLAALAGRVLAGDVRAARDEPAGDRAMIDGLALRADETLGASAYNPIPFQLSAVRDTLRPNGAVRVRAGEALPTGADAVVPLDLVHFEASGCEVIEPVARDNEIERAGSQFGEGAFLFASGRRVTPADIGLLALAGIAQAAVVRQPRVGLILAASGWTEADSAPHAASAALLRQLIERDGGTASGPQRVDAARAALSRASDAAEQDVVFIIGGAGQNADNPALLALADTGEIAIGEVALHPGGVLAIGRTGTGRCVFLLPGAPGACLWAYELLAGRAVRRLAGREAAPPFPTRTMTTAVKIVSAIGMTEVFPVRRREDGRIELITAVARETLLAAAQADGFVVIPEAREGVAAGSEVTVWLLGDGYRRSGARDIETP